MPQGMEWLLIIGAVVLLFGASRIPQLAKSLGQARREFKEGMKEGEKEESDANKQLPNTNAPQISQVSDDQLIEEMRRRASEKQL
ncbi:MAG: twin-arginine translocase TatA/TatE family subunit [Pyrinomonadaceae bacterium]|nr:twin-arginine translocase TatA/TatE family subunit [Pyrinomonadaceae bacterium]